jgi:hypothetical protein
MNLMLHRSHTISNLCKQPEKDEQSSLRLSLSVELKCNGETIEVKLRNFELL